METFLSIVFTGIAYAMVLYLISVGLSVTMGLLGIANLAHGSFAMAGGYLALVMMKWLALPFFVAVPAAALMVAVAGIVMEQLLYSRVYARGEFDQVLLSIGIIFISIAGANFLFGPLSNVIDLPD